MMLVMLGFTEFYMYMRTISLVEHTAFVVADSIGQMTRVVNNNSTSSNNNLGTLWNAATLVAAPAALNSQGGVVITSMCDATTTPCGTVAPAAQSLVAGKPKIYWQAAAPWNQTSMVSRVTPASLLPATWPFRNGDAAIVVEVFYSYNPFPMVSGLWAQAPGTQIIYERVYVRPRSGQPLALSSS
jgi:hypothetical protein